MFKGRNAETREVPVVEHPCCMGELRVSKFRESNSVESFYIVDEKMPDGSMVKCVVNDIYMLFNQQRLDKMTTANLLNYLANSSVTSDGMAALRSKLSDAQLISFIKSRYCQSPSELLSYSKWLEENANSLEITPEIQAEIDAIRNKAQNGGKDDSGDDGESPDPIV